LSSITNFFSRMLGGSVAKLDKILRDYKENELQYWLDWADARSRYNEAEALSRAAKSDNVQQMKYEEQKNRIKKLIDQVEKKKVDIEDSILRQSNAIIKDSTRLKDYWEMKKAKVDEDVAKESYAEIKKSTTDETIHDLFDTKIQKAVKIADEKDKKFQEQYGSLSSGKFFDQAPDDQSDNDLKVSGIKISDLISKPIGDLQAKLKTIDSDKLETILKYLVDKLKDIKTQRDEDIKSVKDRIQDKSQIGKEIDDLNKSVKPAIDSIQSKVDYINQLLLSSKGGSVEEKPVTKPVTTEAPAAEVKKEESKPEPKQEQTVDLSQVKKNFQEAKGTIEEALGEQIDDDVFAHLRNDLIALYGMIMNANKGMSSKTLQFGLIDFAEGLYKYKSQNNSLKKDLTQKELDKQFEKYTK